MNPTKPPFIPSPDWLSKKKIDGFSLSFESLAQTRLPELFGQLERQIEKALPLSPFATDGHGVATILKSEPFKLHIKGLDKELIKAAQHTASLKGEDAAKRSKEFAGVYVMLAAKRPFYVGISRTTIFRLRSHVRNLDHNTASLLFSMVKDLTKHSGRRGDLDFTSSDAGKVQGWLRAQKVAILPLACPVERYAFELYASMKLMTGRWNTFETH
jgi:hypothetical protein